MALRLWLCHSSPLLEKDPKSHFSSATASFLLPPFKHNPFSTISSSSSSSSSSSYPWTSSFSHTNPRNQKKRSTTNLTLLASPKATENVASDDGNEEARKTRKFNYDNDDDDDEDRPHGSHSSQRANAANDPLIMSDEERREWRMKIREVLDSTPDVEEEMDPVEKKKKIEKLLADYPLVVDEDDPDWPDDADGWGFNFNQFFNKITIKNVKKDDEDENYDSDKEIVWQDDNYIRPIKDITTAEWEETVFKDISPLIILVHNRYKRPQDNEKLKDELDKAVQVFWNSGLPSPRCVAVDAVVEDELASALGVSVFPELIFTKAGKILYREKVIRTADELSKIMAFFFYGAFRPPCLNESVGDSQEKIPSMSA